MHCTDLHKGFSLSPEDRKKIEQSDEPIYDAIEEYDTLRVIPGKEREGYIFLNALHGLASYETLHNNMRETLSNYENLKH